MNSEYLQNQLDRIIYALGLKNPTRAQIEAVKSVLVLVWHDAQNECVSVAHDGFSAEMSLNYELTVG
jgi:hypothetical protein